MKSVSGFMPVENSNFKIALFASMALHLAAMVFLPAMTVKKPPSLKEESFNKVRLTFTKKPKPEPRPSAANSRSKPVKAHSVMKLQPVSAVQPRTLQNHLPSRPVPVKALSVPMTQVEAVPNASPVSPKTVSPVRPHAATALNRKTGSLPKVDFKPAVPRKVMNRETGGSARSAASLHKRTSISHSWKNAVIHRKAPGKEPVQATSVKSYRVNRGEHMARSVVPAQPIQHESAEKGGRRASTQSRGRAVLENPRTGSLGVNASIAPRVPSMNRIQGLQGNPISARRVSGFGRLESVARVSPRAIAPVPSNEQSNDQGISERELKTLLGRFFQSVGEQIARARVYPDFARRMGYQGKILVAFEIGREGQLLNLSINQSSGFEILDEAALEAVREAGPYPPIPEKIRKETIKLKLPISYFLR